MTHTYDLHTDCCTRCGQLRQTAEDTRDLWDELIAWATQHGLPLPDPDRCEVAA